jgi:hypothetical protein
MAGTIANIAISVFLALENVDQLALRQHQLAGNAPLGQPALHLRGEVWVAQTDQPFQILACPIALQTK